MSGICGIIHFDGAPVEQAVLQKMAEAAAHRGPDGTGFWRKQNAGLAHLALNLTPESLHETQPLQQDDLILTADARLDNRPELIAVLELRGRPPAEITDAALILSAYQHWGTGCAEHLAGDFAFALWDAKEEYFFAARDPMALRPFYYCIEPARVLFASEVKQILEAPGVEARLFEPAVAAHLAGPYGKPDWTFYKGIKQLKPAHALLARNGRHRTWRYWQADSGRRIRYRDEAEYAEHFLELFKEAVRCRLRSAKPVGLMLSGGMDSGSIASTAGWLMNSDKAQGYPPFRTYSWAFDELPSGDERHISRGIVEHYGLEAADVPADELWPLKGYPAHGPDRDEPYLRVYQPLINQTVARAKEGGSGLLMAGDRGDWVVGSWIYDYVGLLRAGRWRALWSDLRAYSQLMGRPIRNVIKAQLLKPMLASLRGPERQSTPARPSYPHWIRPDFARRVGLTDIIRQSTPPSDIENAACRRRYQLIFSHAALRWVMHSERTRAKFGLGFADPWSDHRLAEFALAVPQWVLHRAGDYKRLVRRAMRGIMPEEVRRTATKIEPVSLFERGLKGQARDTVWNLIHNSQAAARSYLDEPALHDSYAAFLRGKPLDGDFWWPLTLEMWLRRYGF